MLHLVTFLIINGNIITTIVQKKIVQGASKTSFDRSSLLDKARIMWKRLQQKIF